MAAVEEALGRACGWLFREAQRPGQMAVMAASRVLTDAYTFPSETTRQGHLGFLLRLAADERGSRGDGWRRPRRPSVWRSRPASIRLRARRASARYVEMLQRGQDGRATTSKSGAGQAADSQGAGRGAAGGGSALTEAAIDAIRRPIAGRECRSAEVRRGVDERASTPVPPDGAEARRRGGRAGVHARRLRPIAIRRRPRRASTCTRRRRST